MSIADDVENKNAYKIARPDEGDPKHWVLCTRDDYAAIKQKTPRILECW